MQICGNKSGTLHADRLGSGSKGKCIYCESSESKWFTPKEFEKYGGRETSKDWKRSVKLDGKPFYFYLKSGDLKIHAFNCYCQICVGTEGGESSEGGPGPIKFFSPPNRKRRAEDELAMPSMVSRYQSSNPSSSNFDSNSNDMSQLLSLINQSIDKANTIDKNQNDDDSENKTCSLPITVAARSDTVPILSENNLANSTYHQSFHISVKSTFEQISNKASCIEESISTLSGLLVNMKSDIASLKQIVNQFEKNCRSPNHKPEFQNVITDTLAQVINQTELSKTRKREDTGHCANCNRPAPFKCGRCNSARYCSEFCQQRDWPIHNKTCGTKVHVLSADFDDKLVNEASHSSMSLEENETVIKLEDIENLEMNQDNAMAEVTVSSDESLESNEMTDKANGIEDEPSSSSTYLQSQEVVHVGEPTNCDHEDDR